MSRPLTSLETPGAFTLGCNYWASHAGTEMWRNWQPDVIDADFGGKPCFAEEIGTMGPMVAGYEVSARFTRVNLFSL